MKTMITAAVAAISTVAISVAPASADKVVSSNVYTLCATQGAFGWKLSGEGFNSNFTDWTVNKVVGQAIGAGNCESGWVMNSTVDPRIVFGANTNFNGIDTAYDTTVTGTNTEVTTSPASKRLTAEYQGWAPPRISNRDTGAMKNLVGYDNRGRALYLVLNGSQAGNIQKWSETKLIDRSIKNGCRGLNCHNLRYDASQDTTTVTVDSETEVTKTHNFTKTRTICPSVWSYEFVSPSGDSVATFTQRAGECTERKYTTSYDEVFTFKSRGVKSTTGDRYVTQQ